MQNPRPDTALVRTASLAILGFLCAAAAPAATRYWGGGTALIPDSTPLTTNILVLTGTWDTTTKNWSTDTAGSTYTTWSNSGTNNEAYIGYGLTWPSVSGVNCTLTLAGSVALNRLSGALGTPGGNHVIYLTAAAPVTLTLNGSSPGFWGSSDDVRYDSLSLESNIRLAGTGGITQSGVIRLVLKGDSSGLSGPVVVVDGGMLLAGGLLTGISSFELQRAASGESEGLTVAPTTSGARNELGDTCVVQLGGGFLTYTGQRHNTTPSTESIRKVVLDSFGLLDPSGSAGSGTQKGQLILTDAVAGIDRGANGKGVLAVGAYRASALDLNTDVIVQNGLTAGVILPWMGHTRGYAVQMTPSGVITNWPMTDAPLNQSSWVADSDYRVIGEAGAPSGAVPTMSIRSLGAFMGTSRSVTIAAANTLTVSSGHINCGRSTGLGGYGERTLTITGGQLTSGSPDLYLVTAQPEGNLTITSVIMGDVNVVAGGIAAVTLNGTTANTYTGVTYANGDTVLSKSDNVMAVPGKLDIGGNGTVTANQDQQINNAATVLIRAGGTLALGGGDDQTFHNAITNAGGRIQVNSGTLLLDSAGTGLAFNGGTFTSANSAGSIRLLTDVSYAATSTQQALFSDAVGEVIHLAFIAGAATRTFDVADSSTLAAGVPEMVAAMPFTQSTGTAALRKTGGGVLSMTAAHLYSGGTTIEDGSLLANNAAGSATGSGPVTVSDTGTLGGSGTVSGAITASGGGSIDAGSVAGATGTLTCGNTVTVGVGGILHVDLASGANDQITITSGNLSVAGTVTPALLGGYAPTSNTEWTIATVAGGGSISIAGASVAPGYTLSVSGQNLILSNPARGTLITIH